MSVDMQAAVGFFGLAVIAVLRPLPPAWSLTLRRFRRDANRWLDQTCNPLNETKENA